MPNSLSSHCALNPFPVPSANKLMWSITVTQMVKFLLASKTPKGQWGQWGLALESTVVTRWSVIPGPVMCSYQCYQGDPSQPLWPALYYVVSSKELEIFRLAVWQGGHKLRFNVFPFNCQRLTHRDRGWCRGSGLSQRHWTSGFSDLPLHLGQALCPVMRDWLKLMRTGSPALLPVPFYLKAI